MGRHSSSPTVRTFKEYKEEIDRRSNLSVVIAEDSPGPKDQPLDNQNIIEPDQVVFSIQVASSKNKIPTDPSSFKGYQGVRILSDGRWYKYLIGRDINYHDALEKCNTIKADYPDAFVVASKNDKLVPLKDALQEINK